MHNDWYWKNVKTEEIVSPILTTQKEARQWKREHKEEFKGQLLLLCWKSNGGMMRRVIR